MSRFDNGSVTRNCQKEKHSPYNDSFSITQIQLDSPSLSTVRKLLDIERAKGTSRQPYNVQKISQNQTINTLRVHTHLNNDLHPLPTPGVVPTASINLRPCFYLHTSTIRASIPTRNINGPRTTIHKSIITNAERSLSQYFSKTKAKKWLGVPHKQLQSRHQTERIKLFERKR
jgi:hypothetical protein